jgi:hypothetical protein
MTDTTWCNQHERLEAVEDVEKVRQFMVHRGRIKTDRMACEVHATTDSDCKVKFIGGPAWKLTLTRTSGGEVWKP